MNYGILIGCAVLALTAILMNVWAVTKSLKGELRLGMIVLLLLTAMRYITLIVYGDSPTYSLMLRLRYFYFASSIGLTLTMLLACWYVIPYLREKLEPLLIPFLFFPWQAFYLYVIVKQPTELVRGSRFGYELTLTGEFPFYLSVAQGSMALILIGTCLVAMLRYKHLQIRTQLLFLMAAQVLLVLDGLGYYFPGMRLFSPFTLTEAFGFAATYYAFSKPVKMHLKTVSGA